MAASKTNMLSAMKVRLHGMTSARWTTQDKITQYKGLINLYTRDRKIIDVDKVVQQKKQYKELKNLQKAIIADRELLDNAIGGDRQQLRITLADHKEMQLAFENSAPTKVIENVHQLNFNKRKELDKLSFKMKLKEQELIDLKLLLAECEDALKFENSGPISLEKQAQIITGKVQDAILRKEAALAIRQIYSQILHIMRRDSLYFDAILTTIEKDGVAQGKSMINATQLGQMATEYLDDRRTEYQTLEKVIMKDMTTHKTDLAVAAQQAEMASVNLRQLLRRDSDINLCHVQIVETESDTQLRSDMESIETTLSFLKDTTLVPTFDHIFPCLKEQMRQRERLIEMAAKCEKNRDILLNKLNHAELMAHVLENTMVDTTFEYKARKKELFDEIAKEKEQKRLVDELIDKRHLLIAKVRISLRQLQQLCRPIKLPEGDSKKTTPAVKKERSRDLSMSLVEKPTPPDVDEIDGCKMIPILTQKLEMLMKAMPEPFDPTKTDEAYKLFEVWMKEQFITKEFKKEVTDESLLEGIFVELTHDVLTREDIKKQSADIVAENSKNDDLVPMFAVKKKKKKFK